VYRIHSKHIIILHDDSHIKASPREKYSSLIILKNNDSVTITSKEVSTQNKLCNQNVSYQILITLSTAVLRSNLTRTESFSQYLKRSIVKEDCHNWVINHGEPVQHSSGEKIGQTCEKVKKNLTNFTHWSLTIKYNFFQIILNQWNLLMVHLQNISGRITENNRNNVFQNNIPFVPSH